jgi:hypothetical protein
VAGIAAPGGNTCMRQFFRNHGLSVVLLLIFMGTMLGQIFTGYREHNDERRDHGQARIGMGEYLRSGHFWEATAENWESEFLQMAMFVLLTACLYQKGSAESKDPDADEAVDNDPRLSRHDPKAPGPVRRGGWVLWLYSHSLSITFLLMFLVSFVIHAAGGAMQYSEDQRLHGQPPVTTLQYLGTSQFWFESTQNWQSEFLSLLAMVVLTIHLREKGSAESKPVAAPHWEGGGEDPKLVPVPVDADNKPVAQPA